MGLLGDIIKEVGKEVLKEAVNSLTDQEYNVTLVFSSRNSPDPWLNSAERNKGLSQIINFIFYEILRIRPEKETNVSTLIDRRDGGIDSFVLTNGDVSVCFGLFGEIGTYAISVISKNKNLITNIAIELKSALETIVVINRIVEDELPPYHNIDWINEAKRELINRWTQKKSQLYADGIQTEINFTEGEADTLEELLDVFDKLLRKDDLISNCEFYREGRKLVVDEEYEAPVSIYENDEAKLDVYYDDVTCRNLAEWMTDTDFQCLFFKYSLDDESFIATFSPESYNYLDEPDVVGRFYIALGEAEVELEIRLDGNYPLVEYNKENINLGKIFEGLGKEFILDELESFIKKLEENN